MGYRLYDCVKLADGTVGFLIESFDDGAYLFEYATPGSEEPYAQMFIKLEDIVRHASQEEGPQPYVGWYGQAEI